MASIGAFMALSKSPTASRTSRCGRRAWGWVEQWLALDVTWIPPATDATARCYSQLASTINVTSNLVPDAMLAALASNTVRCCGRPTRTSRVSQACNGSTRWQVARPRCGRAVRVGRDAALHGRAHTRVGRLGGADHLPTVGSLVADRSAHRHRLSPASPACHRVHATRRVFASSGDFRRDRGRDPTRRSATTRSVGTSTESGTTLPGARRPRRLIGRRDPRDRTWASTSGARTLGASMFGAWVPTRRILRCARSAPTMWPPAAGHESDDRVAGGAAEIDLRRIAAESTIW